MSEITLGPTLVGLAVLLFVYRYWPSFEFLRRNKINNRGRWSMYEKHRDLQLYDRYEDKILEMLDNDLHDGLITGEEYNRWLKRFSFMPGLKPQPLTPPKEAIRFRLNYRYSFPDGRTVSLYTNNDTVFGRYFPDFREQSIPTGSPVLSKHPNFFKEGN